ncbi:hypothetical protein [Streptomyces sp. NPDC001815]|uniref:hypothetical protein n=1 Tax=Streptomyces sp. NPDC001815 TaxID=3154526 RepID=UPI0033232149
MSNNDPVQKPFYNENKKKNWIHLLLAFCVLYVFIGVAYMLSGASAAEAWLKPLGLFAPAAGVAFVMQRRHSQ